MLKYFIHPLQTIKRVIAKIKHLIRKTLEKTGYRIVNVGWNTINNDIKPETIIDVGTGFGTDDLYAEFPNSKYFLIDPVIEYEPAIKEILKKHEGDYEIVAVGQEEGEITLNVDIDRPVLTSIHSRTKLTERSGNLLEERKVKIKRLDKLVKEHQLESPYGLKIDTEGHELEVLHGASGILDDTIFIILELSIQERFEDSYHAKEIFEFLWENNFKIKNILSAETDGKGLVRFLDILFEKK